MAWQGQTKPDAFFCGFVAGFHANRGLLEGWIPTLLLLRDYNIPSFFTMYRWGHLPDPYSPSLSGRRHFHSLNVSVLFHKLHLILINSALIPLWSTQWGGAPVLPPHTVRAGDAHQGQWTESVHLPEARAGSGLPQQTPRLLQLSLHLLPGASSSRRARGTQTRKLSLRGKKKLCFSATL